MSTPKDGGPAFPFPADHTCNGSNGMSLRDWFAGKALAGWLASYEGDAPHPVKNDTVYDLARDAYAVADAMLRARGDQP